MESKKLYRVLIGNIFSHLTPEQIKDIMFFPQIPSRTMADEDSKIERICLSESIEGCFTSIGWVEVEKLFDEYFDDEKEAVRVVILEFDMNNLNKKYLFSWEMLDEKQLVPDAYVTKEYWYMLPEKPSNVEIRYLESYSMEGKIEYVLPFELRDKEMDVDDFLEEAIEVPLIENLKWL